MPDFAFLDHAIGNLEVPTIRIHQREVSIGTLAPYDYAIRSHDGAPIQRYVARSPWRDDREVFWTRASALHWLQTVAQVSA